MKHRFLGKTLIAMIGLCLATQHARAVTWAHAFVTYMKPDQAVYYTDANEIATIEFVTTGHYVEIGSAPANEPMTVHWMMWVGAVDIEMPWADADISLGQSIHADGMGHWIHYAHNTGNLDGYEQMTTGNYQAMGVGEITIDEPPADRAYGSRQDPVPKHDYTVELG